MRLAALNSQLLREYFLMKGYVDGDFSHLIWTYSIICLNPDQTSLIFV